MGNIKKLTHLNYKEVFDLSQYAFQYKLDKEAYLKKVKEAENHEIYAYYVQEELAGKMHLIPLEVYLNNQEIKMGGISAVATWPEYAGRQIASKLMTYLLQKMYKEDYLVSYLHPYHIGFYRRFGFELAFEKRVSTIKIDLFKATKCHASFDRKAKIADLNEIYKVYISRFEGGLIRDQAWWQQRVLKDEEKIIIRTEDEAAYLLYEIKHNKMSIKELAYTHTNVLNAVINFISKHASMVDDVELVSPNSHPIKHYLMNPKYQEVVEPYFMARIINVGLFLERFLINKNFKEIRLKISDDLIEENNQIFKLRTDSEKVSVEPLASSSHFDFELKVHELTALCYNYYTVHELIAMKKMTVPESIYSTLSVLFERKTTAFIDYY